MPGIGDQGDRVRQQAVNGLDRDEADVEHDPDEEGAAVIRRGMGVTMAVVMPVLMLAGGETGRGDGQV
jgi:hypothetical protein